MNTSDNVVEKVCELIDLGWTNAEITKEVKVQPTLIILIRRGFTYRNISEKYNFSKGFAYTYEHNTTQKYMGFKGRVHRDPSQVFPRVTDK